MGLIVGVCSYLALMVGLAAAIKLSAVVATQIGTAANLTGRWVPFICFLLIFILVALLVRTLSAVIQKLTEKIVPGFIIRIGGALFFMLIYLSGIALLLFYVDQMHLLPESQIQGSVTYPFIKVLGPYAVDSLGYIIPAFQNMFKDLQLFFETASHTL